MKDAKHDRLDIYSKMTEHHKVDRYKRSLMFGDGKSGENGKNTRNHRFDNKKEIKLSMMALRKYKGKTDTNKWLLVTEGRGTQVKHYGYTCKLIM